MSKNLSIVQNSNLADSSNLSYTLYHSMKISELGRLSEFKRFNIFNEEVNAPGEKLKTSEISLNSSSLNNNKNTIIQYPEYLPSSFGAEMTVNQIKPITPQDKYSADWILLASLLGLGALIVIKQVRSAFFGKLFSSIMGYTLSYALYTEHKKNPSLIMLWMNLLYILNFSIFAYQILQYFEFTSELSYLYSVGGIALMLSALKLSRNILSKIGAFIFRVKHSDSEYSFHINQINTYLTIIFYIGIFGIAYTPYPETAIGTVVFVFIMGYILRIFRLYKINIKSNIRISYLFLYLCILEILPFFALSRAAIHFVIK